MIAITATWKHGHFIPDETVDWPEGCRLVVQPAAACEIEPASDDDFQGDDPESLARWLAWFDSLEPLVATPEEHARFAAARQAQKEFEKSHFEAHAEELKSVWE